MIIDYNLIIGIVGGAIFGAIFTWWSISQSRRLAVESGALKKAIPLIYFLKQKDLTRNLRNPIGNTNWVLLCPKDANLTIYSLSFQVANEGDDLLDSPVFMVQGSIDCIKNTPEHLFKLECNPGVLKDSIKRSIINLGKFNQISYILPDIGNNSALELTDCFCFTNTVNVPVAGEALSLDGIKVRYSAKFAFSYILSLGLLARDYPSIKHDLKMMCLPADSIEEAKDILGREISDRKGNNKKYYAFLKFGVEKKKKLGKENVYFMKKYMEEGFDMKVIYM